MRRQATPPQAERHTLAQCVVYLRDSIGLAKKLSDGLRRSGGLDRRAIAHIGGGQANAGELCRGRDLNLVQLQTKTGGLAVEIVAVARSQCEHQKLATVGGRTATRTLGRDAQLMFGIAGADCNLVTTKRVDDAC